MTINTSNSNQLTQSLNIDFFNKIYFGPPGTGKSYKVNDLTKSSKHPVYRVTFHEDYSYYDFVGQYKPVVIMDYVKKIATKKNWTESDQEPSPVISYEFVPGIFINSYVTAYKNPNDNVFLIIEELNRGNCSAIFGDIFQLLDRDEKGSKYQIKPSKELKDYLKSHNVAYDELTLPQNLKIIATMNTSDQSLFPIDSAFKRRWQQEYCKIDYNHKSLSSILIEGTKQKWSDFIKKVNDNILTILNNEDKQIGHWFVQPTIQKNGDKEIAFISKDDFKYKVLSYLYYDVFKHNRADMFKEKSFSNLLEQDIIQIIEHITKTRGD